MKWSSKKYLGPWRKKFALMPHYDSACQCSVWLQWYYYHTGSSVAERDSYRCPACLTVEMLQKREEEPRDIWGLAGVAQSASTYGLSPGLQAAKQALSDLALRELQLRQKTAQTEATLCKPSLDYAKAALGLGTAKGSYPTKFLTTP
jgi:hypothetical protein